MIDLADKILSDHHDWSCDTEWFIQPFAVLLNEVEDNKDSQLYIIYRSGDIWNFRTSAKACVAQVIGQAQSGHLV